VATSNSAVATSNSAVATSNSASSPDAVGRSVVYPLRVPEILT